MDSSGLQWTLPLNLSISEWEISFFGSGVHWSPLDFTGLNWTISVKWTEWMEWTPLPKKEIFFIVEHLLRTLNMFKLY